jgi:hypothetical protein
MMKWFLMEHRSDAVGLASVPAITAAKRRMSVASVSYTVQPMPLLFGDIHNRGDFATDEADPSD